jgi:hypothetical protein
MRERSPPARGRQAPPSRPGWRHEVLLVIVGDEHNLEPAVWCVQVGPPVRVQNLHSAGLGARAWHGNSIRQQAGNPRLGKSTGVQIHGDTARFQTLSMAGRGVKPAHRYVKWSAATTGDRPSVVTTRTSTVPARCPGANSTSRCRDTDADLFAGDVDGPEANCGGVGEVCTDDDDTCTAGRTALS